MINYSSITERNFNNMRYLSKIRAKARDYKLHEYCTKKDAIQLDGYEYPKLTSEELQQCQRVWSSIDLQRRDTAWISVYKKEHGFSPYMVGLYQSCLLRAALNPKIQLHAFDNKAMYDIYFPDIQFAKTYVRRISGVLYDLDMNCITLERAVDILKDQGNYIIKPALDTMQGSGVKKVVLEDSGKDAEKKILESIHGQHGDFIAQEVIRQHPSISSLNPTSVNCCRVTTLYIDGKFDYSTVLKVGKQGSYRDNWFTSYFVGVNKKGITEEVAYDNAVNRIYNFDNGLRIGGIKLPRYDEMIDLVCHLHKRMFPNCGMIGWDVMVDVDNQIRFIEMNFTCPGFIAEQMCSGTFFEPFADLINYRLKK